MFLFNSLYVGMKVIHDAGITHRDLKSANVLVTEKRRERKGKEKEERNSFILNMAFFQFTIPLTHTTSHLRRYASVSLNQISRSKLR